MCSDALQLRGENQEKSFCAPMWQPNGIDFCLGLISTFCTSAVWSALPAAAFHLVQLASKISHHRHSHSDPSFISSVFFSHSNLWSWAQVKGLGVSCLARCHVHYNVTIIKGRKNLRVQTVNEISDLRPPCLLPRRPPGRSLPIVPLLQLVLPVCGTIQRLLGVSHLSLEPFSCRSICTIRLVNVSKENQIIITL